jgi:hypothetical protein
LVPADSMAASTPHVIVPSNRHATMGKLPAPPRVSNCGRPSTTVSSMPPVPNVILATPGTMQP